MDNVNCQSCNQPLQLDPSLLNISRAQADQITASLPRAPSASPLGRSARIASLSASPASKQAYQDASSRRRPPSALPAHFPPLSPSASPQAPRPGPADSFILLNESTVLTAPSLPNSAANPSFTPAFPSSSSTSSAAPPPPPSPAALLSLLSSRTDVDHPLCVECARALTEGLTARVEDVAFERDRLIAFERRAIATSPSTTGDGPRKSEQDLEALRRKLEQVQEEEESAKTSLLSLEDQHILLQSQLAALELESEELEASETLYLQQHNASLLSLSRLETSLQSTHTRAALDGRELERLERANVWVDVFCIGVGGGEGIGGGRVATINGLRLGRAARGPMVDWPEINAAWGLATFCLHSLARKTNFVFENYRLIPLGSFSRIEDADGRNPLELHGTSDILSRFLQNRRFEQGMIAYLDCLRQLLAHASRTSSPTEPFTAPYHILRDKIGEPGREASITKGYAPSSSGLSASTSASGAGDSHHSHRVEDDNWTRACRYTLISLNRLTGWATRAGAEGGQQS